jgi:fructose-1,6-bisphosphatase I
MKNKREFVEELKDLKFDVDIIDVVIKISESSEEIAKLLSMANLNENVTMKAGYENCQGEEVNLLDNFANDLFIKSIGRCVSVHTIISEENSLPIYLPKPFGAKYVVALDPLDGSSNIDVNVAVGSIFAIYKSYGRNPNELSGDNLVASGYVMYGSSTQLVLSNGYSSSLFIYNPDSKRFVLVNDSLQIPVEGITYSINEGSSESFNDQTKLYIRRCKLDQRIGARYIGSLVADFHRNLIKGGVFLYPSTSQYPSGKLRVLYECLPLAFIAKSCGGKSISNGDFTLNLPVTNIHQRADLIIGSINMVNDFISCRNITYLKMA